MSRTHNNKTMFSDEELQIIAEIYKKNIERDGAVTLSIREAAISQYLSNSYGKTYDLVSESWTLAVVSFLVNNGYEIKKKD